MTREDIQKKFDRDFSTTEYVRLGSKPQMTVREINKFDKIIIDEKLIDYLKGFFDERFVGEIVPKVFSNTLIEVKQDGGILRFFVTFPEDKPDYVYIDVFTGWEFLGKVFFININQRAYTPDLQGEMYFSSNMYNIKQNDPNYNSDVIRNIGRNAPMILAIAFMYVEANQSVKDVYKEETVYEQVSVEKAEKEKIEYRKKKNNVKRDKVFVPRKRRIYTVKKTQVTENNLREYIYSRWKVRGYTYTRKDGKVITVKEHFKNRHLPNQGIEKEGKDYILRKRDEDV